ncbi:hypothetical protein NL676_035942 [Syzygium grande]|nr:hypothetical protein NL676_035942 [Syzygium grande]
MAFGVRGSARINSKMRSSLNIENDPSLGLAPAVARLLSRRATGSFRPRSGHLQEVRGGGLQLLREVPGVGPEEPRGRPPGLGLVSFDLLRGQLASTGEYIRRIMSRRWDPYTRRCLSDCTEMYGDSSSRMEDVIPAYRAGRYADVQTWLSGVLTCEDTCESQFSERGKVSPLTKQNRDTRQLGTIALCIVDFVKTGS